MALMAIIICNTHEVVITRQILDYTNNLSLPAYYVQGLGDTTDVTLGSPSMGQCRLSVVHILVSGQCQLIIIPVFLVNY